MHCVTGMYLRDITNITFFNSVFECELSECLLLLFFNVWVFFMCGER